MERGGKEQMGVKMRRHRCNSISIWGYTTLVAHWGSENWKAFGEKTEPVTKLCLKSLLAPTVAKRDFRDSALAIRMSLTFFCLLGSFSVWKRQRREWEGRQGPGAGSRSLTKDHFNRDY